MNEIATEVSWLSCAPVSSTVDAERTSHDILEVHSPYVVCRVLWTAGLRKGIEMAFYSNASNNSTWRGVDYFENGKVRFSHAVDGSVYEGEVEGSEGRVYSVRIDVKHPKRSACTCPFAEGRRVVCKHMVALYFESVPGSLDAFYRDMKEAEARYELEEQRWREETLASITKQVKSMSAKEAKEKLIDMLYQDMLADRYRDDYW